MKKINLISFAIFTSLIFFSCGGKKSQELKTSDSSKAKLKIGYAQVGHESAWRIANSESFKNTFTAEKGYELSFIDANGSQDKQIEVMKSFISKKVDYIVVAPCVETGWDSILQETKKAGIPVILSDRQMKVEDDDLYLCWVGGDFLQEGKNAVKWLENYLEQTGLDKERIRIVDLQGTLGASAQVGRTNGILEGIRTHDNWQLVAQESGNFTIDGGRATMQHIVDSIGINSIDVLFAENDEMAIGAIDVIKNAGKVPGKDIIIISFDATREAFARMIAGEINCSCECNPLHGPRVEEIIKKLEKGESVEKFQYVQEAVFDQSNAKELISGRTY